MTAKESCPQCSREREFYRGPASATIESGRAWMDVAGITPGTTLFSERVVEALTELDPEAFTPHPVTELIAANKTLRKYPQPNYYYLEIHGRISLDLTSGGAHFSEPLKPCPVCKYVSQRPIRLSIAYTPLMETWDGRDLFYVNNYLGGGMYCTEKVVELARRNHWTNFILSPMEGYTEYYREADKRCASQGVDYLAKEWPPVYPMWWFPKWARFRGFPVWVLEDLGDAYAVLANDNRLKEHLEEWRDGGRCPHYGQIPKSRAGDLEILEQPAWRQKWNIADQI